MKKVRWGIIGCGNVTEVKSGPGFQKAKDSELVAVMRRSAELAQDFTRRHNVPRWYTDANALLQDPEIDAVYVATPPSSHKQFTLAAAAAGKPVYVEKPMALNFAECSEMLAACKRARVPLFVAYYRRALPRFLKVKSLLAAAEIGEVRHVNIQLYQPAPTSPVNLDQNWRVNPEIAGCGYFCDLGSHMLDLVQFFLGRIVSATGRSANQGNWYPAEDIVTAIFTLENNVQGAGTWCFSTGQDMDKTEIIGTAGKITYATFANEPVVLTNGRGTEKFEIVNPENIQQPLIQTIVDELLGRGACASTGETGAQTNLVMDQILGRL